MRLNVSYDLFHHANLKTPSINIIDLSSYNHIILGGEKIQERSELLRGVSKK